MNKEDQIISMIEQILEHAQEAKKTIIRLEKKIYGNGGEEGLVTQVSNLNLRWAIAKYLIGGISFVMLGAVVKYINI